MQKIKLTIANRIYPLNVPSDQEEGLRNAAKKIDIMIKHYEENYAVKDKQDVLAMCALQYAAQLEIKHQNNIESEPSEKVNELISLIDLHLSTY